MMQTWAPIEYQQEISEGFFKASVRYLKENTLVIEFKKKVWIFKSQSQELPFRTIFLVESLPLPQYHGQICWKRI